MKKIYKIITSVIIVCIAVSFSGCSNYKELNSFDIVAGMAIDKDGEDYLVTFEVLELKSTQEGDASSPLIMETKGKTLASAIASLKLELSKELYFGNMQIVILNKDIAKDEGLLGVIDWFLRDSMLRETSEILLSTEETAGEILKAKSMDSSIVSYAIETILELEIETSSHLNNMSVFKIFNILETEGKELLLPAISLIEEGKEKLITVDKIAIFKDGYFLDFLTEELMPFLSFILNGMEKYRLAFPLSSDEKAYATYYIKNSKTKYKFDYSDPENIKLSLEIAVTGILNEIKKSVTGSVETVSFENEIQEYIKEKIQETLEILQKDLQTDVPGFLNMIYSENPKVWEKIKNNQEEIFKKIKVDIIVNVTIENKGDINK